MNTLTICTFLSIFFYSIAAEENISNSTSDITKSTPLTSTITVYPTETEITTHFHTKLLSFIPTTKNKNNLVDEQTTSDKIILIDEITTPPVVTKKAMSFLTLLIVVVVLILLVLVSILLTVFGYEHVRKYLTEKESKNIDIIEANNITKLFSVNEKEADGKGEEKGNLNSVSIKSQETDGDVGIVCDFNEVGKRTSIKNVKDL